MSRLTVFQRPEQARRHREKLQSLRTSGFAAVLYVTHEADIDQIRKAFDSEKISLLRGPTTYESKVRPGSPLRYTQPMELPDDAFRHILTHHLRQTRSVGQNLIWIEESPVVVCAIPMKLQVSHLQTESGRNLEFSPNFIMQEAWDVRAIVDFLAQINRVAFVDELTNASALQLRSLGIDPTNSSVFESVVGLDIWSLTGSIGRPKESPFDGAREAAVFGWPLTAILNYTSDHIVNHFYEQMSHEEVFSRIREGFCFMQDHAIFLTAACTLEITHFDDWVPQRSWDRLRDYGFDSSTLYVLGIALARNASYRAIAEMSGESMMRLTRNDHQLTALEEDAEHDRALSLIQVLDALRALHLGFREERSQTVDLEFQALFGDSHFERASRQRLDEVRRLSLDGRDKREQGASQRGITRLTLAAAVLAVASIPTAVEQLWSWTEAEELAKVGAAGAVMAMALWLTKRAAAHTRD